MDWKVLTRRLQTNFGCFKGLRSKWITPVEIRDKAIRAKKAGKLCSRGLSPKMKPPESVSSSFDMQKYVMSCHAMPFHQPHSISQFPVHGCCKMVVVVEQLSIYVPRMPPSRSMNLASPRCLVLWDERYDSVDQQELSKDPGETFTGEMISSGPFLPSKIVILDRVM